MSLIKRAALTLYGLYAWSSFLLLGGATLILLLMLPGLKLRRAVGAFGARVWLAVAGIRIRFSGGDKLPATPAVIVANHTSYIDGVLLKAILPTRYSFVIKKEMVRVPLAGLLLRRIGAEFVDRFNRHSGAMDARRLMRAANGGGSLVFFPEGTFTEKLGVGRFHGGAFVIAARAHLPIAPVAIHGARQIWPPASLWLHPGKVHIEVLPVVVPPESLPAQSIANYQRDQSRLAIVSALQEPDLENDDGVAQLAAEKSKY